MFLRRNILLKGTLYFIILFALVFCILVRLSTIRDVIFLFVEGILARPISRYYWGKIIINLSTFMLTSISMFTLVFFINNNTDVIKAIPTVKRIIEKNKVLLLIKCICWFFVTYFLLLYLNNFILGINLPVSATGLDPSYVWALNRISTEHSFFWGKDITFTYGPYGFLFYLALFY